MIFEKFPKYLSVRCYQSIMTKHNLFKYFLFWFILFISYQYVTSKRIKPSPKPSYDIAVPMHGVLKSNKRTPVDTAEFLAQRESDKSNEAGFLENFGLLKFNHSEMHISLALIYVRDDNQSFFMSNYVASANSSYRSRFLLINETRRMQNGYVHLKLASNGQHLFINSTNSLLIASDDPTSFQLLPVLDQVNQFNIFVNSKDNQPLQGLVTPSSRPPFKFYLQSRYPNEQLANFQFQPFQLDVEMFYNGSRSTILTTIQLIHNLTANFANQTASYAKLLELMNLYEHISNGAEIFSLGAYIYTDIGVNSSLYLSLPGQVQLICSGQPLSLYYLPIYPENPDYQIPMKYSYGSELHKNILPYKFTYSTWADRWAITYATNHQLYISNTNGEFKLEDVLTEEKFYNFHLYLDKEEEVLSLNYYYYEQADKEAGVETGVAGLDDREHYYPIDNDLYSDVSELDYGFGIRHCFKQRGCETNDDAQYFSVKEYLGAIDRRLR